ncbi:MAG: hypothetical protein VX733_15085 [Candidatus Latescibacterota bacterium]|nr:hypothetical protein [Candidatus Latescibacterota bacterium]
MAFHSTFINARREAIIICLVWLVAALWSVPYCYSAGYHLPPGEPVQTIWGIPEWVVWGVAVPWLLADIFALWFCLGYMADDDLGEGEVPI